MQLEYTVGIPVIMLHMMWKSVEILPRIWLLSVLTGQGSSEYVRAIFVHQKGVQVLVVPDSGFLWSVVAHPFHRGCGTANFDGSIVPCVQHQKQLQQNRRTKQQLKQIPTHDFQKGDRYDTCAISLTNMRMGTSCGCFLLLVPITAAVWTPGSLGSRRPAPSASSLLIGTLRRTSRRKKRRGKKVMRKGSPLPQNRPHFWTLAPHLTFFAP